MEKGDSRMKFHLLRPGTRFRCQGETYRKISALMAAGESDETQRLVPRSAQVDILDDSGQVIVNLLPDSLPGHLFEATLVEFAASCMAAAAGIGPPLTANQLEQLEHAIATAQSETLAQLAKRQRSTE